MTDFHISRLIMLAAIATAALVGGILWRLKVKGWSVLFGLLLAAGTGAAWLSNLYGQFAWFILVGALLFAALVWFAFHKLSKNVRPTTITWSQYLRGQGSLLLFFLLLGGGFAWLSVSYGPYPGRVSKGGQFIKFENLDPSQHPVYEEVDVESSKEISVFTSSKEPENGSATVTIYLDHGQAGRLEVGLLDSEPKVWSRWDQANAGKHMSLVATAPTRTGAIPATKVDVFVYLGPK